MGIKRVTLNPKEIVNGFHLTQIQDNIDLSITSIQNSEFNKGVFVATTLITSQDNTINHGLDRAVQGWTIVKKDSQCDVWESSTENKFSNKTIILKSSATVRVKIYFF